MQTEFQIRAPNGRIRAEAESFAGARLGARCVLEEEGDAYVDVFAEGGVFAISRFRLDEDGHLVETTDDCRRRYNGRAT